VPESFYSEFSQAGTEFEAVIIVTYYAFTTLSTIGYGDKHPKSDIERMVASLIMLIGVVVFSFIMDSFTKIVLTLKKAYKENDDPERLTGWFNILQRFKSDGQVDPFLRDEIEEFFSYYWKKDKNCAKKDLNG
jgi:hypothetical protein